MRKIEQKMLDAIKAKNSVFLGNTNVFFVSARESGNPHGSRSEVWLFDNQIACFWHESGELEINDYCLKRWPTNTTLSRLRALGANVYRRNGIAYINDKAV